MRSPAKAIISSVHPSLHLSHPTPATFVWNTLIRAPTRSSAPPFTPIAAYRRMRLHSVDPDFYTFPFLLESFSSPSSLHSGQATHAHIFLSGFASDPFVQTSLINMYINCGCMNSARQVFDESSFPDLPSWNSIINGILKFGGFDAARRLFDAMPERNVVTWSCMINGYVKFGKCKEALELFREMQKEEVAPNEYTLSSILAACGHLGALEHGRWAHAYIDRWGVEIDVVLGTSLIDMYAKCGSIERARWVFNDLGDQKDVMAWGAMISGLGMNGHGQECIGMFEEMQRNGVRPNDVTLLGVLCGCVHEGLVKEGREYFWKMSKVFGIKPKIEHYGCLVDLLGRAGLINDALEVINSMPMKPDVLIWGAILSGSRMHRNIKACEFALEQLIELEPTNSGAYVLLSNVYAKMGRWEDVKNIRYLMENKGIKKIPGCSLVEMDGTMHEFFSGDQLHPESIEIVEMLDEIMKKLKIAGYVGNIKEVLLDLDEKEKEWALSLHSEKLAIAFCFIKTSPGASIRIIKNLRICLDCHVAIKLISKVFHREITVRDCNRFHHFKDGECSCKDYW